MYEYEIYFPATDETDILYGYSVNDLARRYPDIPPSTYIILSRIYAN